MWGMVKPSIRGSPAVVSMILARRGTAKDDQRESNQRLSRNSGAQRGASALSVQVVHGLLRTVKATFSEEPVKNIHSASVGPEPHTDS